MQPTLTCIGGGGSGGGGSGKVERVINKSRHPNVTSLGTAIEAAFVGMYKPFFPKYIEKISSTRGCTRPEKNKAARR
ncbi:hypothetical protein ALC53_07237 [Atta colombica]|uniref:Uncharacterized protein n=1 Tax=Atta colombica TaxID=520822 RepID=A0A195BDF6_9HYME|nr:hypothetical protein ALC53_07237 [Atta colombica]